MTGKFNIVLKNASLGTVVKDITIDAAISDFYKFESTFGFPSMNRVSERTYANITATSSDQDINPQSCMSARFNAAGVRLFEDALDLDRHKIKVNPKSKYCGYATRYNSSSSVTTYSSKAGTMSGFTSDIDYTRDFGDRARVSLSWHWDANHGNGTFKSVGVGHAAGVHAIDDEPIQSINSYTPASQGNDFYSYAGVTKDNSAIVINTDTGIMRGTDHPIYTPFLYARSNSIPVFYYEQGNNIVQLMLTDINVLTDNSYHTTVKYRIIDKKWMNEFTIGIAQGIHPLSCPYDYFNDCKEDGEFTINSGAYPLRYPEYNSSTTSVFMPCLVENNAYVVFIAQAGEPGLAPNPDNYDTQRPEYYPVNVYVISGTTPSLRLYNSYYDSPLSKLYTDVTAYTGLSRVLFFEDYSYAIIPPRTNLNEDSYLIKRYLSSDSYAYRVNLDNSVTRYYLDFLPDMNGCFAFANIYSGNTPYIVAGNFINKDTGAFEEYYFSTVDMGDAAGIDASLITTITRIKSLYDNPFYMLMKPDGRVFYMLLNTNFLFAKANLPETITKTSDYTLDITLTLNIF